MARFDRFFLCLLTAGAVLASPSYSQDTTTYTYDELGRVKTVTNPSGAKSGYDYDKADNRTRAQTALNGVLTSNNRAPTCSDWGVSNGAPSNYGTARMGPFPSDAFTGHCSDPDGDTLVVTNPTTIPFYFDINYGDSLQFSYTVSDGKGGTATATLYACRGTPNCHSF